MIGGVEQVWVAIEPVDMRLGVDGLSLKIQEALGRSACDGRAYVFRNRRGTRLKLLVWDGTGVWMCHRRLHRGQFVWPIEGDKVCCLSTQTWDWLVTGVDWQRLQARAQSLWRL